MNSLSVGNPCQESQEVENERHEYGADIEIFRLEEDRPTKSELFIIAQLKRQIKGCSPSADLETPAESFGKLVRGLRVRRNCGINSLSEKTGLTRAEILQLEYGCMGFEKLMDVFPQLGRGLSVSPKILFASLLDLIEEELV